MTYVIGPSHIQKPVMRPEFEAYFPHDTIFDGHCGLPVWSSHILPLLKENAAKGHEVVWMVSDWKLNNADYDELQHKFVIDTFGQGGNVSRQFMEPRHIEFLSTHSLKVIDSVIAAVPDVKLIFWCLYKRTKASGNSSYPPAVWYDEVVKRYRDNVIDISEYTTPTEFNRIMVIDDCGHPSERGFQLLARMLQGDRGGVTTIEGEGSPSIGGR